MNIALFKGLIGCDNPLKAHEMRVPVPERAARCGGFREPFRQAESSPQCGAELLASSAGPSTMVLDVHRSLQAAPRSAPGARLGTSAEPKEPRQ